MLRFILRSFGLLFLACAFAALIVDGTRSLGADALVLTSVGEALATMAPAKLAAIEALLRGLGPLLWQAFAATVLRMPVWLGCGAIGAGLFAVTVRRRGPVGFSSR